MATRKSKPSSSLRGAYVAPTMEDRVRMLEKRQRQSDRNRAWQNSMWRKLAISACLYVTSSLLLMMMLIPGWYACALIPVIGYWLSGVALWLVRDAWENLPNHHP